MFRGEEVIQRQVTEESDGWVVYRKHHNCHNCLKFLMHHKCYMCYKLAENTSDQCVKSVTSLAVEQEGLLETGDTRARVQSTLPHTNQSTVTLLHTNQSTVTLLHTNQSTVNTTTHQSEYSNTASHQSEYSQHYQTLIRVQ